MVMHYNTYVNTHGTLLSRPLGYLVSALFTGIDRAQEVLLIHKRTLIISYNALECEAG
jgi:hypothetical protein